jgi:subtilisin family serine protease
VARFRVLAIVWLLLQPFGASGVGAEQPFVAGEILVKYRPGVTANQIADIHAASRARASQVIEELGIHRLKLPPGKTVAEMIAAYAGDPRCERAEPNYIGRGGDFIPDDSSFGVLWHLDNTGQLGGTPDADIDAVEGWQITRGSSSVIVAVLDTGIDSDHPEFQGRILPGFDFVNADNDPEADHPHGAQVTGLLAANADNAFSVAGVDHFAQILPVKVLNSLNLGTTFDLAQGIVFAADAGAHVISMSLINYPVGSPLLEDALQYARGAGAVLIACAGNGGIGDADLSGPGASPLTISVGATTDDDERATFSGTGNALDLVAPGFLVRTVLWDSALDTSSTFSGCSAATPIVSGIATLLLSIDPSLSHEAIREILTESAEDLVGPPAEDSSGGDDFFGHGRVNLQGALLSVEVAEPVPAMSSGALVLIAGGLLVLAAVLLGRRRWHA